MNVVKYLDGGIFKGREQSKTENVISSAVAIVTNIHFLEKVWT